jgi:hypothetical protein
VTGIDGVADSNDVKGGRAMRSTAVIGIALLVAVAGSPVVAQVEPLALYDDFSGATIDPDKWIGAEWRRRGGSANRVTLAGTLRMRYAGYAETTSNTGGVFSALVLLFTNPSPITAMRASIIAANWGLLGCPGNASFATEARARLIGSFFNAGTPTPGSNLDDVWAQVRLRRLVTDPENTFRVEASVFRCLDAACNTATGPFFTLGTVPGNTWVTVSVIWDNTNNQFTFQWEPNPPVFFTYTWSDGAAPSFAQKSLEVVTGVPNCTTPPRPYAWLTARYDNVYVNASAAAARALHVPGSARPSMIDAR